MVRTDQFFARAEREARRYGRDAWVFLRELVQNSRDARATEIDVWLGSEEGEERITVIDNGHGMDDADFSRYFLRLYASSKETDNQAVGFFGVGFWSVLLFEPERIEVVSAKQDSRRGIAIDRVGQRVTAIEPGDISTGTRITLVRSARLEPAGFRAEVAARLRHYAGHVRPAAGAAGLVLRLEGEPVNAPFPVPRDCGARFSKRHFEGTLGFGEAPRVRLYQGGILIRDLASLQELIPSRESQPTRWGLFPIVHLEIESSRVLMDRQQVFESRVLHDAVTYCEKRLLGMQRNLVRGLFPMDLPNKVFGLRDRMRDGLMRNVSLLLLIVALLAAGAWFLTPNGTGTVSRPTIAKPGRVQTIDRALDSWGGSIIDSPAGLDYTWDFSYTPPDDMLFRMGTFSYFDPAHGFFPEPSTTDSPYPRYERRDEREVGITMGISSGEALLPLPPGHVLLQGSLTGADNGMVLQNQFGEPLLRLAGGGDHRITYVAVPRSVPVQPPPVSGADRERWPAELMGVIEQARGLPIDGAVTTVGNFIKARFRYTTDRETARVFREYPGSWLEKTMAAGAGDCDIINGLLVLMLRESGHSAFLSIGLVGKQGRAEPTLHAWARYYHNGWQSIDLTRHAAPSAFPGSAPVAGNGEPGPSGMAATGTSPGEPGPPGNTQSGEEAHRSRSVPAWVPLLLMVFPLAWLIWWWRRPPALAQSDRETFIVDLFRHYFYHGGVDDALQLRFRPVFPLIDGGRASLFQIQKMCERGQLLGGAPGDRLLSHLRPGVPVLDVTAPIVTELEQFLPTITRMRELAPLLATYPLHPALFGAKRILEELDPDLEIHQVPDSEIFEEAELPLADTRLGKRHVLIGERGPHFRAMLAALTPDPDQQVFEAVAMVLLHTTFFINERDAFLERLAARPSGWYRREVG